MRTILMVAVLVAVAVPGGAQERLADQLRKGIVEEETGKNLDKAIEAYQSIVARYDEDRKVAGSALFRLAECYRKAGKHEQAIASYQRVLREFLDQQAMVESSHQQLAALGVSDARGVRPERTPRAAAERPRAVTPERPGWTREATPGLAPTGGELPTETLAQTRLALKDMDDRLGRAHDLVAKGLMASSDLQALQVRQMGLIEKFRQQEAEIQLKQQMIVSVQKEIALVQDRITAIEAKVQVGAASPGDTELLQLRRDLLGLQRRLAELQLETRR